MSGIICHHNNRYNFYSEVSDSFRYESSLSRGQVESYIKAEHGQDGLNRLPDRLKRAHDHGCSATDNSLEELLICNRSGKDEEELSFDNCIKIFLS